MIRRIIFCRSRLQRVLRIGTNLMNINTTMSTVDLTGAASITPTAKGDSPTAGETQVVPCVPSGAQDVTSATQRPDEPPKRGTSPSRASSRRGDSSTSSKGSKRHKKHKKAVKTPEKDVTTAVKDDLSTDVMKTSKKTPDASKPTAVAKVVKKRDQTYERAVSKLRHWSDSLLNSDNVTPVTCTQSLPDKEAKAPTPSGGKGGDNQPTPRGTTSGRIEKIKTLPKASRSPRLPSSIEQHC